MVVINFGIFFQLTVQLLIIFLVCRVRPDVWLVYLFSIIFSSFVALTYYLKYGSPFFIGGSDDLMYIMHAHELLEYSWPYSLAEISAIFSGYESHNSIGYVVFVSSLMEAFGPSPLTPIIFNCFLHSFIYFFLSNFLFSHFSVPRLLVFIAIGMNFYILYWGVAHVFREVLVAGLVFLFIYVLVESKKVILRLVIGGFSLSFLSFVRLPMVPVLLSMIASKLTFRFERVFRGLSSSRGIIFFLFGSLFFLGLSYYLGGPIGRYMEAYDAYRSSLAPGLAQSIFISPQIIRPSIKFLSSLGYPFPTFGSWYDFFVSFQIPLNLFFYWYFFRGVKKFSESKYWMLPFFAVSFALMFSVLTFNPRQFIIAVYLILPVCLVGLVHSSRKADAYIILSGALLMFVVYGFYYLLR